MVQTKNQAESVAEILSRAFGSAPDLPQAMAQLILQAKLADSDVRRVDELLAQKRDHGLTAEEESLLQDYLQADSFLTILKSKARRTL